MDNLEVSDALAVIIGMLRLASTPNLGCLLRANQGNKALSDTAPWHQSMAPEDAYTIYTVTLELLHIAGICLQPFVPSSATALLDALGVVPKDQSWKNV
jgi:methionyl-tRNA synthetase